MLQDQTLEYVEVDSFQDQKAHEYQGYRHIATKGDGRYMVIVMARPKRKKRQQKPYISVFETFKEMGLCHVKRKQLLGHSISPLLAPP